MRIGEVFLMSKTKLRKNNFTFSQKKNYFLSFETKDPLELQQLKSLIIRNKKNIKPSILHQPIKIRVQIWNFISRNLIIHGKAWQVRNNLNSNGENSFIPFKQVKADFQTQPSSLKNSIFSYSRLGWIPRNFKILTF